MFSFRHRNNDCIYYVMNRFSRRADGTRESFARYRVEFDLKSPEPRRGWFGYTYDDAAGQPTQTAATGGPENQCSNNHFVGKNNTAVLIRPSSNRSSRNKKKKKCRVRGVSGGGTGNTRIIFPRERTEGAADVRRPRRRSFPKQIVVVLTALRKIEFITALWHNIIMMATLLLLLLV